LNARQARWLAFLSEYDFEMKHIKGKENRVVDALNHTIHIIHVTFEIRLKNDLRERIKSTIDEDEKCRKIMQKIQQQNSGQ